MYIVKKKHLKKKNGMKVCTHIPKGSIFEDEFPEGYRAKSSKYRFKMLAKKAAQNVYDNFVSGKQGFIRTPKYHMAQPKIIIFLKDITITTRRFLMMVDIRSVKRDRSDR